MDFSTFKNKYIIEGELIVLTALHIGSGKEGENNDAPFINIDGRYYIPGSSFRGYLSSKLERLLDSENNFNFIEKKSKEKLNLGDVKLIFGYTNLTKDDKDVKNMQEVRDRVRKKLGLNSEQDTKDIDSMAGRIHIADMPILSKVDSIKRDGIKIDRNTGATEDKGKFDYDVIPAGSRFKINIELNNVEDYQIELIGLALKDIVEKEKKDEKLSGGDLFGGMLSRGIGKCIIPRETLKIKYVDAKNKDMLKNYIFNDDMKKTDAKLLFEIKNLDLELK